MKNISSLVSCVLFVLVAALFAGCHTTITPEEERDASQSTLVWLDDTYGIVNNRELSVLLQRVTQRLASGIYGVALEREIGHVLAEDLRDVKWQMYVVNSEIPNAFSTGAGVMVITLGMLAETRTEAELASVVAHEMAHQILGHTKDALYQVDESKDAPHYAFSLEHELAADSLGLKLLHVARYDISHATQALSIGYRPIRGIVSGVPAKWLSIRMSSLHQEIDSYGSYLPATRNTREFTRVRRHIAGLG